MAPSPPDQLSVLRDVDRAFELADAFEADHQPIAAGRGHEPAPMAILRSQAAAHLAREALHIDAPGSSSRTAKTGGGFGTVGIGGAARRGGGGGQRPPSPRR